MNDKSFAKRALSEMKDAKEACGRAWEHAEKCQKFISAKEAGQWDRDDLDRARNLRVPALQINDALTAIDAIAGEEITGRYQPKLHGRDTEDEGAAEGFNDYLRVERDRGSLEVEESDAFRDLLIQGIAAIELKTDLRDGPIPVTTAENAPVWEYLYDAKARRQNLVDRRWHARGRWVEAEEAERQFPKAKSLFKEAEAQAGVGPWSDRDTGESTPMGSPWAYTNISGGPPYKKRSGEVFLVTYERRETDTSYMVQPTSPAEADVLSQLGEESTDDEGNPRQVELDPDRFRDLQDATEKLLGEPWTSYLEIPRDNYRYAILAGEKVIQSGKRPENYWTTLFLTGTPHKERDSTSWYGAVAKMMDPQRFANAYYSSYIQIIARLAKLSLMMEKGAVEDVSEFERNAARPGAILEVLDMSGIQPLKQDTSSLAAIQETFQFCRESITERVGRDRYSLGRGGDLRRVSGSVISQVQEAASTVLAKYFDSLRRYRIESARLLIRKLHAYWEPEDFRRVIDPKNLPAVLPRDRWLDALAWDIKIDEAPSSTTAKLEAWQSLMQTGFLEALMQGPLAPPPEILIKLFPYITGTDRDLWLSHVQQQQMMMAQQAQQGQGVPQ